MTKPLASACAANAYNYIGRKYSEMDCQAYVERLLADVGIRRDWAGTNAMLRSSEWLDMGTPEQCKAQLGCIPVGAFVGIWEPTGAPAKYKDGKGNLNHIGIKTGVDEGAVHSSASRGVVARSKFADKTIRNGGWNRVLLCRLLDYGNNVENRINGTSTASTAASTSTPISVNTEGEDRPLLRRGKTGEWVTKLQQLLVGEGYAIAIDGDFGYRTQAAVMQYQRRCNLSDDGIVGPMTWDALIGVG